MGGEKEKSKERNLYDRRQTLLDTYKIRIKRDQYEASRKADRLQEKKGAMVEKVNWR